MRFWLGVPDPSWVARTDVPLCVSHVRLRSRKTLRPALGPVVIDSGAFSEVRDRGGWVTTPEEYVEALHRYAGPLRPEWAGPQDTMCEPFLLPGVPTEARQEATVANYLALRELRPPVRIIPSLQGWPGADSYLRHVEMYRAAGVDLLAEPLVGLGSVCRREATREVKAIVWELARAGLRLHGFGCKRGALDGVGHLLVSADSQSWSSRARSEYGKQPEPREPRPMIPGHTHNSCSYCLPWALEWRGALLSARRPAQLTLGTPATA